MICDMSCGRVCDKSRAMCSKTDRGMNQRHDVFNLRPASGLAARELAVSTVCQVVGRSDFPYGTTN